MSAEREKAKEHLKKIEAAFLDMKKTLVYLFETADSKYVTKFVGIRE